MTSRTLVRYVAFSGLTALAVYGCGSSGDTKKVPGEQPDSGEGSGTVKGSGGSSMNSGKGGSPVTTGNGGATAGGAGGTSGSGGSPGSGGTPGGGSGGAKMDGGSSTGAGGTMVKDGGAGDGPKMMMGPAGQKIDTVYIVMEENTDWSKGTGNEKPEKYIKNNPNNPWFNSLLTQYSFAENYVTGIHPSFPNYLILEAGSTLMSEVGLPKLIDPKDPKLHYDAEHLITAIQAAGKTSRWWMEINPTADGGLCGLTSSERGGFSPDHVQPTFFKDIVGTPAAKDTKACKDNVRLISELLANLKKGEEVNYNFLVPSNGHQGEDGDYKGSDAFNKDLITTIMDTSPAFKKGTAVIFVLWDEADFNNTKDASGLIVISPNAKKAYAGMTPYSHLSMVKTVARIFGIKAPGNAGAATVNDLSDLFTSFP